MFPDILHESSNVAWFSQSSLQSLVTHTYLWQGLCCYDICSFLPLPSLFSPTSVCLYHFLFPQCFVLLSGVSSFTHIYPLFLCRLFQCLVHISINHRLPLLTSPQPVPTPASLLPFSSYCFTRKKQNRTLHLIWQVLTYCMPCKSEALRLPAETGVVFYPTTYVRNTVLTCSRVNAPLPPSKY